MVERIAVIDFETANRQSNSACQLGVVLVENGQIVEEREWLIRPKRLYFSPQCIRVHGLTARDCLNAPTWEHVWGSLLPLIENSVVIGHNVGFDASVLQATCQTYDIAAPNLGLQCTRLIAKRSWPGLVSYGLASIAEHLKIRFRHHNALEDARASALVLLEAFNKSRQASLDLLEDQLGIHRGRILSDSIRLPRTARRTRIETVAEPQARFEPKFFRVDGTPASSKIELVRAARRKADAILSHCNGSKPLEGRHVVLVNSLLGLDHEESASFLTQLGAVVQPKINLQTHYLIVGVPQSIQDEQQTLNATKVPQGSKQLDEVEHRSRDGQPIRVLSQRQLLACIPSALAIARGDG